MKKRNKINWPVNSEIPLEKAPYVLTSFEEFDNLVTTKDQVIAITDGWKEGPMAAVLRGGENARAVLNVMAESGIKNITILHLEESISDMEEVFFSSVVVPANSLFDSVSVIWKRDRTFYDLINSISSQYSMLFFGAPLTSSEIMPFYESIKRIYSESVTVVRGIVTECEFDQSDEIYKWVRKRTYDASDFSLLSILISCKKKLNKRVAVLLPSLNEEKTVGRVIKTALEVKDTGLIDEVILIDSSSSDKTVEIARKYNIPVYCHKDIRPEMGTYSGKGEAMFKSAYITDADILVWVDTDIESITPRFFYGLLGPLFTDASLRFAKGYFSRPIRVESSGIELGGGRVTEILAKPWLNIYKPLLSGFIQPLSGTVAIYRDTFLKMKIPVNYGVEMAMLLQVVDFEGIDSTCQVNLGTVIHRSKDEAGLSEMAFQILQVLSDMENDFSENRHHNILRRVISAQSHFEIGSKRFNAVWRTFEGV